MYWHIRTPVTWGMSLSWSGCQMSAVTRGPGGSIILFGVWLKNCNFPARPSHHDGWLAPDKIHQTRFTDRVSDAAYRVQGLLSIKTILDKTVDKWALGTAYSADCSAARCRVPRTRLTIIRPLMARTDNNPAERLLINHSPAQTHKIITGPGWGQHFNRLRALSGPG